MLIDFIKMESQGNSYIYFDFRETGIPFANLSKTAVCVSDKSFGIGSDGMVLILTDPECDALMRIFNSDGSESALCGSALKSIGYYLSQETGYQQTSFKIRTGAGIVQAESIINDNRTIIKADLSSLNKDRSSHQDKFYVGEKVTLHSLSGSPVFVGNHHFVIFDKDQIDSFNTEDILTKGTLIENDPYFTEGVNVEMVRIHSRNRVEARVWERGSGETLACGSGALAIVLAGVKYGYLDNSVEVVFPGGSKFVDIESVNNKYYLSGEVNLICRGSYRYENN